MAGLSVRLLIWLLLVSIPVQALTAVSLRARGPAHAHVEVSTVLHAGFQAAADRDGPLILGDHHGGARHAVHADHADHAVWHAQEHASSRAAHHDHGAADLSVVFIADASDDEPGAGGGAAKTSVIDLPGVLPWAPCNPASPPSCRLKDVAPVGFDSVAALPLYRPPR